MSYILQWICGLVDVSVLLQVTLYGVLCRRRMLSIRY